MKIAVPLMLAGLGLSMCSFAQTVSEADLADEATYLEKISQLSPPKDIPPTLSLARLYIKEKKFPQAEALLNASYDKEEAARVKPERAAPLLAKLAEVEGALEHWKAQADVYARLVETWSAPEGTESSVVVHYLLAEGAACKQAADYGRGEAALTQAVAVQTKLHGATDPSVAYALEKLAELQDRAGQKDKAVETRRMNATPPFPADRLKALKKGGAATPPHLLSKIEP